METTLNTKPFRFWIRWTLVNALIIPLSYLISLIAVVLVHGAFGFNMQEWGTPLSQTLSQIAGGAVIAIGIGMCQFVLLLKLFEVKLSWVYTLVSGFVLGELITGLILWPLGYNRGELRFIEFNALPEALIFVLIGTITGFLQWFLLKRYFSKSIFWITANGLGWGLCILTMAYGYVFPSLMQDHSILSDLLFFCLGSALYGAITGAALIWVLHKKEI